MAEEGNDMGEISTSTSGAKETTNKTMSQMGYAPPMKPKSMGMKKPSIRKPKMRAFSRGK
jgi:hypothetical protein